MAIIRWPAHAKRHKFGIAPAEERRYNGVLYHSRLEVQQAWELDMRKAAREIKDWARQVPFPLEVQGQHIRTYRADFIVEHQDGHYELIECKGRLTYEDKKKWQLFLACWEKKLRHDGWDITKRGAWA